MGQTEPYARTAQRTKPHAGYNSPPSVSCVKESHVKTEEPSSVLISGGKVSVQTSRLNFDGSTLITFCPSLSASCSMLPMVEPVQSLYQPRLSAMRCRLGLMKGMLWDQRGQALGHVSDQAVRIQTFCKSGTQ
mmetsp:Transcript_20553/g.83403  ORF Transcript_20553/g.83403 Transcript_20553/m.83403 type:complete len:133 (+) Transcript_20553:581-979(+)